MENDMKRYTIKEGLELFNLPLLELGKLANEARFEHHPENVVTFVMDRNITYTNVCNVHCKFCAYYVSHKSEKSFVMEMDEVLKKCDELVKLGGTQIMLQGGINPELGLDFYEKLLSTIKENYNLTLHSLSPPEICHIADKEGLSLKETLIRLRNAGLDSIPGGGGEILVDRVRSTISPKKIDADRWMKVMEVAHSIGMKTTATMMFGHIETLEERLLHMKRIRDLQDKTGGFRAFISWPFSPGNNAMRNIKRTSGEDYLKTIAVSRLFMDNVPHINSGWVTEGEKIAQVALSFGANDLGGILMEEVVVKATGLENRVTVSSLKRIVEDAGFKLARRDTEYNVIEYV